MKDFLPDIKFFGSRDMSVNERIDWYCDEYCFECGDCESVNLGDSVSGCECWGTNVFVFEDLKNKRFRIEDCSCRCLCYVPYNKDLSRDQAVDFINSFSDHLNNYLLYDVYNVAVYGES